MCDVGVEPRKSQRLY